MEKYKNSLYYLILSLIVILGIYLRTNLFLSSSVFEDDECRLLITLLNKTALFLPLGDAQSAPPLFLYASKFLGYIFGFKEQVMKFIPFAASIAGIFVFYKVCTGYLNKKLSIIISLLIFTLSKPLIAFSCIFKQYSTDVLIGLLCLYYFPKINIKDLNLKKTIILTAILIVLPFISLPSLFFISALFIQNIKCRKTGIILIPFLITMGLYYCFNLHPSQINLNEYFPNYWDDGFWSPSVKEFIRILLINIKFYFIPNSLSLFSVILLGRGVYCCIADKNKTSNFILIVCSLVLLASLLGIYPLCGRVGLYFISIFILLIIKPLDTKFFAIALIFILLSFYRYNPSYINEISNETSFITYSPKKLMLVIKENFRVDDTILCNSASSASWIFYSGMLKFMPENVYEMDMKPYSKEAAFNYLNNLKKGQNYWIYLIKDYKKSPVSNFVTDWLKDKNVQTYTDRNSTLYYVRL